MGSTKFSVRPKIKTGESLTSYLLRVCICNSISISDLFNSVKIKYKQADLRNAHQIDINPSNTIDLNLLLSLTNLNPNELKICTFNGLINLFMPSNIPLKINNSSTLIKDLFNIKTRKFCTQCLQEDINYKLFWQIKDIFVCPSHKIFLTDSCPECGKQQPYLHMELAKGKCNHCNHSLINIQNTIIDNDDESLKYSQWLYEQLYYLFSLNPTDSINERIFALKLLYICGDFNIFSADHQSKELSRDYKFKLLRIIRSGTPRGFDIGLSVLLRTLWKLRFSIKSFFNLEIPESFIDSITTYINKNSFTCIVQWCPYRNSNEKLVKIKSFRAKTHHSLHICLGCCIKFGVNKNNEQWEEYGDFTKIGFKTVLPLLNSRTNISSISKVTGLSTYKIHKIKSYFTRYKLINSEYINDYTPNYKNTIKTNDILFIINRNETVMRKTAKNQLNIRENDFYYFYYDPIIQKNIYEI